MIIDRRIRKDMFLQQLEIHINLTVLLDLKRLVQEYQKVTETFLEIRLQACITLICVLYVTLSTTIITIHEERSTRQINFGIKNQAVNSDLNIITKPDFISIVGNNSQSIPSVYQLAVKYQSNVEDEITQINNVTINYKHPGRVHVRPKDGLGLVVH